MKRTLSKILLFASVAVFLFSSCKKTEVTPTTNDSSSGAEYTWNGVSYNSKQSSGNGVTNINISEKICGRYYIYSYSGSTNGSNTYYNYINLYLPADGASGTYSIENYAGTAPGIDLAANKVWLFVYSLTVSGTNYTYDYGYASSGSVTVEKNGDAIKATFNDIDTYSTTNFASSFSTGKLTGNITTNSLTYDFSSIDCSVQTTPGSNPDTTTTTVPDENPLAGTVSVLGVNYPILKDNFSYASVNGVIIGSATSNTVSGVNTLSGIFYLNFKNSDANVIAGNYDITDYVSSGYPDGGKAMFYAIIGDDQSYKITYGYAVSGTLSVTVADGNITITLANVVLNSSADGTGNNLGNATGTITKPQ